MGLALRARCCEAALDCGCREDCCCNNWASGEEGGPSSARSSEATTRATTWLATDMPHVARPQRVVLRHTAGGCGKKVRLGEQARIRMCLSV